jgi:NAD(P)-dependent dehydrogenase (short-subunit alcohol dehydrogenase family)
MSNPRTAVITGSASGIGAAIRARLEADGLRVIGIDLKGQEIAADLSTPDGRAAAVAAAWTTAASDALVPGRPGPRSPTGPSSCRSTTSAMEVLEGLFRRCRPTRASRGDDLLELDLDDADA